VRELLAWLRVPRPSRHPEPWAEMRAGPAVCVEHLRAIPCRVGDETCIISNQPEDVLMVYAYLKGN